MRHLPFQLLIKWRIVNGAPEGSGPYTNQILPTMLISEITRKSRGFGGHRRETYNQTDYIYIPGYCTIVEISGNARAKRDLHFHMRMQKKLVDWLVRGMPT